MHEPSLQEFLPAVAGFLGSYYLAIAMLNGTAALYLWRSGKSTTYCRLFGILPITSALVLVVVTLAFTIMAPLAYSGTPSVMAMVSVPQTLRDLIDANTNAVTYSVGSTILVAVLFLGRTFFVKPAVAWTMLNLSLLMMGLSITDPSFAAIVTKPDNVPIVALMFLLGFFTWLATSRAVKNDQRRKNDLPPLESLDNEKVLVWPDLVYIELICMVAVTAVLFFWALGLQAPLEEAANSVKTPNPSKAPWYFLGLQEMLVYYDPWMAGVVAPSLIVFGLMAIPYLDFNKGGNGYYTIDERKFAYITFQLGFFLLWIMLIIMGTFLRGPNWNIFGPYEYWDPHKVLALNNVDLSQYFWTGLLSQPLPKAPDGSGGFVSFLYIMLREAPGIAALGFYFLALPPIMAMTVLKKYFLRMGFVRFMIMSNLLLFMASLPIKMVLRWTINLKYIVAIPEFILNF